MPETPKRPADPKQRWMTFLRNHAKAIVASDFFVVVTATFQLVYVFVVLEVARRRVLHFNVTRHPTADWTLQQFRECIVGDEGYRFIIHDRDRIYSRDLDEGLKTLGFTDPAGGASGAPWEVPGPGVYRVSADLGSTALISDSFLTPNGLAFSPDESVLYINDTRRGHIRAFDLLPNGQLAKQTDRRLRRPEGTRTGRARWYEGRHRRQCLLRRRRWHEFSISRESPWY